MAKDKPEAGQAGKILGTMRCPVGAIVSQGDDPKRLDLCTISDRDEKGKVVRCKETADVSRHSTEKSTIVALCPKHGAVLANRGIWEKEVK